MLTLSHCFLISYFNIDYSHVGLVKRCVVHELVLEGGRLEGDEVDSNGVGWVAGLVGSGGVETLNSKE